MFYTGEVCYLGVMNRMFEDNTHTVYMINPVMISETGEYEMSESTAALLASGYSNPVDHKELFAIRTKTQVDIRCPYVSFIVDDEVYKKILEQFVIE
jgi:uncharacterized Zn-finger protein